jgi:hypothetical protein
LPKANALGSPAILSLAEKGALIISVDENVTAMKAPAAIFGSGKGGRGYGNSVVRARSYAEAAGLLAAHKAGIFFEAITKDVQPIQVTEL